MNSPSLLMPILRHFLSLQYWHWFLWCWSMGQFLFPLHEYVRFLLTDLLKKDLQPEGEISMFKIGFYTNETKVSLQFVLGDKLMILSFYIQTCNIVELFQNIFKETYYTNNIACPITERFSYIDWVVLSKLLLSKSVFYSYRLYRRRLWKI